MSVRQGNKYSKSDFMKSTKTFSAHSHVDTLSLHQNVLHQPKSFTLEIKQKTFSYRFMIIKVYCDCQSLTSFCPFSSQRYCPGAFVVGAAYGLLGTYVPVPEYCLLDGGAYTGA